MYVDLLCSSKLALNFTMLENKIILKLQLGQADESVRPSVLPYLQDKAATRVATCAL